MFNDNNFKNTVTNKNGNIYLFIYFAIWLCISLITIISAIFSFVVSTESLNSMSGVGIKNLYIAILCINIIVGIVTFILSILGLYKLNEDICSENILIIFAMIPMSINLLSSIIVQVIMMNISYTSIQIVLIIIAIISLGFTIGAMSIDATLNPSAKKICIFISLIGYLILYLLSSVLTSNSVSTIDMVQIVFNLLCLPILFLYALVEII